MTFFITKNLQFEHEISTGSKFQDYTTNKSVIIKKSRKDSVELIPSTNIRIYIGISSLKKHVDDISKRDNN